MKLLIDECIDWRLAREFAEHQVSTVPQMGWNGLKNGALLSLAQDQFDVFITVDQNLPSQQNLSNFNIAVVVLAAATNRLLDLLPLVPKTLAAIGFAKPGQAVVVTA